MDVLFALAEWHTLAKLKMHTDPTIGLLRFATKELGRLLRRFKCEVCPDYETRELPSEEAARGRRQARKAANGKGKATAPAARTSPKKKEYNLETYKGHSLGDYVSAILWAGTSDSWSTQPASIYNRLSSLANSTLFRENLSIVASKDFMPVRTRTALCVK
jgi:hypothetical protein